MGDTTNYYTKQQNSWVPQESFPDKFDFKDTFIRYYCASSQIELNELHYRYINSSSFVTPYIFLHEMPAIHIISQDSLSIPTNEDFELSSSDLTKLFHRDSYLKD